MQTPFPWKRVAKVSIVALLLAVLVAWVEVTPPGVLGKSVGIGYAVCHRLPAHSPFFGDVQFPLCFRCSGMYLAALFTWVWLNLTAPRKGGFPRGVVAGVLAVFFLAWAGDGLNAFLGDLIGRNLYPPNNTLRLITGLGMGVVMATLLYAITQQTYWQQWHPQPALDGPRLIGALIGAALLGGLMIWRPPALLYPLALLSTGMVLLMLTLIYTAFALGLLRRENTARTWWDLRWFLLAGLTVALGQVLLLDIGRLSLTHVWIGALP